MAKTEFIRARVEPELKTQTEEIFSKLGLSPTDAITLFYVQVILHGGLPFAVRIPNNETIEAMRQAETGEGLREYADQDALKAEHG
ncbi:MAG: type II toxin-antitoxin system RelB/DinJ family antitoxin [Gemmatimonadota bacterium]|nr:type II toxin-antitoxin system RelB/DinJ family antitoxin [Gemmatimonadota bacterium]